MTVCNLQSVLDVGEIIHFRFLAQVAPCGHVDFKDP